MADPEMLFGVRTVIRLLLQSLHEYLTHKDNCDVDLPAGAITALDTLVSFMDELEALNPPGPK